MEFRIVRLIATLLFFVFVSGLVYTLAGWWGFGLGAVLMGVMAGFLWRAEAEAAADRRAAPGEVPPSGPPQQTPQQDPSSWS